MPNKLFEKRPKKYGKDSRVCRHTGSTRGVIQKYGMNLNRKSFRELAAQIGFVKVDIELLSTSNRSDAARLTKVFSSNYNRCNIFASNPAVVKIDFNSEVNSFAPHAITFSTFLMDSSVFKDKSSKSRSFDLTSTF